MEYGNDGNDGNGYKSRSFGNRSSSGGENGGGGYRSSSERSVIQIPGTHIGKIIGPAGRHINEMQRQYNVRIQINKMANSDGTKDAEISGNNANDIQDAIKAINEQINAPFERRQGGFREGGGTEDRGGSRGGGGGRYNDDREGGFYQGQRNNYSRGSGERGERGNGGSGDRYNDRSGFRRDEN